ncbi:MAG: c-type cytochrome domain-containing protein [Planctomycetota bacterium]
MMRFGFRLLYPIASWTMALWLVLGTSAIRVDAQEGISSRQNRAIKQIQKNIDLAGQQFKSENYESSRRYIERAIEEFEKIADSPSEELEKALTPEYTRLVKAHELLGAKNQKLPELKPFGGMSGAGGVISFTKSVAPIIVSRCGNCHVNRSRGDFSFASFEALDKSTAIAYGLPDTSRLIEVIESGEMPPGGTKVAEEEIKILKDWIKQGAKFDGEDPRASLNTYVMARRPERQRVVAKAPTGKETVSFGLDVAPVILEHCAICHITQNPRGNFSMADFRALLRGGDGGNPIVPGKSDESPLIARLRGDGVQVMPPQGKLDDKIIDKIARWIDEGASFDGGDDRLAMFTVAAKVKADSQSHEELSADRLALASRTWKLVMDDVKSLEVPSDNFVVTGSTTESRLNDVSLLCERLAPKIAKELRAASGRPLVKGNISVFVFDRRYDFNEFGKMVEKRDFPKSLKGHWGYTTIDAYATLLMTRNQTVEDVQPLIASQIASVHVASLGPEIPRWFADGLGLYTAKKIYSRDDAMKSLDGNAETAFSEMVRPDDFIQNKMPADKAALVSYLFVKNLRSSGSSFSKLMKALANDVNFEEAFRKSYGKTPTEMINGQNPNEPRRSR